MQEILESPPKTYVVAGSRPWNRQVFVDTIQKCPGRWIYVDLPEKLTEEFLFELNPRFIFFLHWSHYVQEDIYSKYECVCFHMTDVPYGRGGSPLQNMIARGHRMTKLSALLMSESLDAGPVYMKKNLSLEGGAEEIYLRAGRLSADMIRSIIKEEITPIVQQGEVVTFKRRKPDESEIQSEKTLLGFFDFIRMLDADGYPRAFLRQGNFRLEFSRATLYNGRIEASVTIIKDIIKE